MGLLMVEDPYRVPLLLDSKHWPYREAGGSGAEGKESSGPGVGDQGTGSP